MSLLGIEHHNNLHAGARTASRLLAAILGVGLMAGCSMLQPYVEYPERVSQGPQNEMEATRAQSQKIDSIRERVTANRNETTITRNVLGLGVFGAIVGAGTTALYGGSADLVLGLGIGGATGYTAGQLYVPATKSQLYATAANSLHCVSNAGFKLDATASAAKEERNKLDDDDKVGKLSKGLSRCKDSDALTDKVEQSARNALAAYTKADAQLDAVLAKDAEVADRLRQGADRIVDALNTELGKNQPNLANVLNAASNVGPMGRTIVSSQADVDKPNIEQASTNLVDGERGDDGCDQQTVRQIKSRTDIVSTQAKSIETKLRDALNEVDKINKACAANFASTAALSLGQDQITISKDSTYNVQISGGNPPFSVKWIDGKTPASNEIGAAVVGRNVVLTGRSQLPVDGKEFTLQVRDSQPLPETATITVKTAGSQ